MEIRCYKYHGEDSLGNYIFTLIEEEGGNFLDRKECINYIKEYVITELKEFEVDFSAIEVSTIDKSDLKGTFKSVYKESDIGKKECYFGSNSISKDTSEDIKTILEDLNLILYCRYIFSYE